MPKLYRDATTARHETPDVAELRRLLDVNLTRQPGNIRWATSSQQVLNARPAWPKRARNLRGQFS